MKAFLAGLVALSCAQSAFALDPSEIFDKASPSIFAVRALDAQERLLRSGSAVTIGQERLVTSCHLLVKAQSVQVRRGGISYDATLEHADVERDLCTLIAEGLVAPAPAIAPLSEVRIGQRVYAVTYPEKLAISLTEGLIAGVQAGNPALPPIQTTATLAPGASGGGLFDERGRLIGIVTLNVARGNLPPNLNFALPAGWIAEVPERAQLALEKRDAERAAKAVTGVAIGQLPAVGSIWTYSMRDRVFDGRNRNFSVQLTGVDGWNVTEIVSSETDKATYVSNAHELTFYPRALGGESVFELSPYLLAHIPKPRLPLPEKLQAYPSGIYAASWQIRVTDARSEAVQVPAGRFEAVRMVVKGENPAITEPPMYGAGANSRDYRTQRFEFTAWYVAALGRYVQVRHRMFNRMGDEIGDELIQLTKFNLPAAAIEAKGK